MDTKNVLTELVGSKLVTDFLVSKNNFQSEIDINKTAIETTLLNAADGLAKEVARGGDSRLVYENFKEGSPVLAKIVADINKAKADGRVYTPDSRTKKLLTMEAIDQMRNSGGLYMDNIPNKAQKQLEILREQTLKSLPSKDRVNYVSTDEAFSSAGSNLVSAIGDEFGVISKGMGFLKDAMIGQEQTTSWEELESESSAAGGKIGRNLYDFVKTATFGTVMGAGLSAAESIIEGADSDYSDVVSGKEFESVVDDKGNKMVGIDLINMLENAINANMNDKRLNDKGQNQASNRVIPYPNNKANKELRKDYLDPFFITKSSKDLGEIKEMNEKLINVGYNKQNREFYISAPGVRKGGETKDYIITAKPEELVAAGLGSIVNDVDTSVVDYKYDPANQSAKTIEIKNYIPKTLDGSSENKGVLTQIKLKAKFDKNVEKKGANDELQSIPFQKAYPLIYEAMLSNNMSVVYKPVLNQGYMPKIQLYDDVVLMEAPILKGSFQPDVYSESNPEYIKQGVNYLESLLNSKNFVYLDSLEEKIKENKN